jgi:hypothetical protein
LRRPRRSEPVEGNIVRHRYARCPRSAGVEGPITSERNASEPERSHGRPQAAEPTGPHREGEEPKPMMHGHEKSDSAIVATKPPNKAGDRQRRRWSEGRRPRRTRTDSARAGHSAGKACPRAGARTEGRGQPSNIRGGSRMQESCTYGSGAARLAAIPAGASPANTRSPVHVVVIPSGREGDQTAGSLEVKALWGRGDLVRSVKGGRATWQAVA